MARLLLHDIKVKLLSPLRHALWDDLRLVATVLGDNSPIAQSDEVAVNPSDFTWSLEIEVYVPSKDLFAVEIKGGDPNRRNIIDIGLIEVNPRDLVADPEKNEHYLIRNLSVPDDTVYSLEMRANFEIQPISDYFGMDMSSLSSNIQELLRSGGWLETEELKIISENIRLLQTTSSMKSKFWKALGVLYRQRFRLCHRKSDIDEVISLYEEAIREMAWNDPQDVLDWGKALLDRFNQFNDASNIPLLLQKVGENEQLSLQPSILDAVGNTLLARFERLGDLADIDEAIVKFQEAIRLTPDDHPGKRSQLGNLGVCFQIRFDRMGDISDLDQSVIKLKEAVRLTPDNYPDRPSYLSELWGSLFTRFQRAGILSDLNESVATIEETVRLTPENHPDRPSHLSNLGKTLLKRFERLGDISDVNESVNIFQEANELTPDGHPMKPSRMSKLGMSLLTRFKRLADISDLNEAIIKSETADQLTPDNHPDKPMHLEIIGVSLLKRFERLGNIPDIDESVIKLKEAIRLTPDNLPSKPSRLNGLSISLCARFERLGLISDINESVEKSEEALRLTSDDHPDRPSWLMNLGASLCTRFRRFGDISDLDQAIVKSEAAIQLVSDDHPDKPLHLNSLASSLSRRFERLGHISDINESVIKLEEAIRLIPEGHPFKPTLLSNLGISLNKRFHRFGDVVDLNESVIKFQDAMQITPGDRPNHLLRLSNLGGALLTRFRRLGDISDLNESAVKFQEAIRLTPDNNPAKPALRSNLANCLQNRFDRLGDVSDLSNSVVELEEALQLTPDDHPDKPSYLNSLGHTLLRRFEQLGEISDANESVISLQKATRLTPDDHPVKPIFLSNLANSLGNRFSRFGDISDLNESINKFQDSVRLTPNDHPDMLSRLSNLAVSLHNRFNRLGNISDLNESVIKSEEAARLTPDNHPDKPSRLCNLGNTLFRRFYQLGDITDLNETATRLEEGIRLTPDNHPVKSSLLSTLGYSFFARFDQLGDISDLNNSIVKIEEGVHLTPDSHPEKPPRLINLGTSLLTRFGQLHELTDCEQALHSFSVAANASSGPIYDRVNATSRWALCLRILKTPPSVIGEAYAIGMNLIPQLAFPGASVSDRHHQILQVGSIVQDATAIAIGARNTKLAVEWLEQGRSVIWGQILQLRSPLDDLKRDHPKLGRDFHDVSIKLGAAGHQRQIMEPTISIQSDHSEALEDYTSDSHVLALKREILLNDIRQLPGYEKFLLPKPLAQLKPLASSGFIIMFTISELDKRCDALILTPGRSEEVKHVPLDSFTPQRARQMHRSLNMTLSRSSRNILSTDPQSSSGIRKATGSDSMTERIDETFYKILGRQMTGEEEEPNSLARKLVSYASKDTSPENTLKAILADLWTFAVKPVLDALTIQKPHSEAERTRIWWCPTGILTFLPFHAAGLYGPTDSPNSKVSDLVVSSYTPTISALINAHEKSHSEQMSPEILVVGEPNADGQSQLPGVEKEIKVIENEVRNRMHMVSLIGPQARVKPVLEGMKKASWVHFACHGIQNIRAPTESALLLAGSSRLTLLDITNQNLSNKALAFLSACQTATGDKKLFEEAVHLASGMLVAGYRGVVATLWSVTDRDGPEVAREFYRSIMEQDEGPDPRKAAMALDHAVAKLRNEKNAPLLSWVPFVHFGI